jgi:hypothetical protein
MAGVVFGLLLTVSATLAVRRQSVDHLKGK